VKDSGVGASYPRQCGSKIDLQRAIEKQRDLFRACSIVEACSRANASPMHSIETTSDRHAAGSAWSVVRATAQEWMPEAR